MFPHQNCSSGRFYFVKLFILDFYCLHLQMSNWLFQQFMRYILHGHQGLSVVQLRVVVLKPWNGLSHSEREVVTNYSGLIQSVTKRVTIVTESVMLTCAGHCSPTELHLNDRNFFWITTLYSNCILCLPEFCWLRLLHFFFLNILHLVYVWRNAYYSRDIKPSENFLF